MEQQQRTQLRDSLRQARRALSAEQQSAAARTVADKIIGMAGFQAASRTAFYLATDGELDPRPLLDHALASGKSCYLPVIAADDGGDSEPLGFAPFHDDSVLTVNKWGIGEPPAVDLLPATELDLVVVPLVGFDARCFRLGMGKGFYDRSFSFKLSDQTRRPLLLGLAHACQRVDGLLAESWDVRMDAVITAEKTYRPAAA